MAQYIAGKIKMQEESVVVEGYKTEFLYEVRKGDILILDSEEGIPYVVESVEDNTHLTLSTPYYGRFYGVFVDYSITRLFVSMFEFPEISNEYKGFSTLITLYLRELDCLFKHADMINPNDPVCGGEGGGG